MKKYTVVIFYKAIRGENKNNSANNCKTVKTHYFILFGVPTAYIKNK